MDPRTLAHYEKNAQHRFAAYVTATGGVAKFFQASFPVGGTLLDVGAGSGRDLHRLLELGYNAWGLEPATAMRQLAVRHFPRLSDRIAAGAPPELEHPAHFPDTFDGIVCSAVLMHLPESELFDTMLALRASLKVHGRLLVSISAGRAGLDAEHRDADGRLYTPLEADRLVLLAERLGFRLVSRWERPDTFRRDGLTWSTLLLEKVDAVGRPLDRIEGVLNRDRKVATYKLALLRGLCDLALLDDRRIDWSRAGEVGVPLDELAERWLFFYWPLIESAMFVPQIQAEHPDHGKPIKFRRALAALIDHYRPLGGLDAFAIDYRTGRMDPVARTRLAQATPDIRAAIVQGPVQHTEQGTMFRFDRSSQRVYFDGTLWKELCLAGHWIRDALILRWAELTARFAPHLGKGTVLDLLMIEPTPGREVSVARDIYLGTTDLHCVWSDAPICTSRQLAVDHALPLALWHSNALWNLLPARAAVNRQKSDRVPRPEFLRRRKDALIHAWSLLCDRAPALFDAEVTQLLGEQNRLDWQNPLFDYFKRSCEYGIFIRGARPWALWNWLWYLQRRNSSVPSLATKLEPPLQRQSLNQQIDYWKEVIKEQELYCIYSETRLSPDNMALDHFLPWSFIGHDSLWNLIPVHPRANASKGNRLPKMDIYFDRFIMMQSKGLKVSKRILSEKRWKKHVVSFIADLHIHDCEDLIRPAAIKEAYTQTMPPLVQIAKISGFSPDWTYRY